MAERKKTEEESGEKYRMMPAKLRESLQTILLYCDSFVACEKPLEQAKMRKVLLDSLRIFLKEMEETV